jgi:transcriptional regulator with XRE-family HTH domain
VTKAIDPTDVLVGRRVRLQRMSLGMSQTKLAEALGLTFQQVQKYERGVNRIGASRLEQIARILGVPAGFFFEGIVEEQGDGAGEAAAISTFLATAEGVQLIKAFLRLSNPSVRRSIITLVEDVAAAEPSTEVAS